MSTRVVWVTTDELAPDGQDDLFAGIDLVLAAPGQQVPEADLVVLDSRALGGLAGVLEARARIHAPVLVLCGPVELEGLGEPLQQTDGILLHDSPLALVAHQLRLLAGWSSLQVDGLTKLRVRRALLAELDRVLPGAAEDRPISLLLVDIDLFKSVNDEHGHNVGDLILQELAGRIVSSCPAEAFTARFSGEKFVVLLHVGEEEAVSHAELIREAVRYRPFVDDVRVTVSAGVATARHPITARELLRQMDEALYAAKAGGRDRTVHYSDLEREAIRADRDIDLFAFENVTRVIAERVASIITRRGRRLFHEIKQQADVDSLTGLFSRRYLDRRLTFELDESRRTGLPLSVALIDIDFFGQVNKTHGWPAGDRVLAGLALLLRQSVRGADWIARYGGEEFCVVLAGTDLQTARGVLERVRAAVASHPFSVGTDADPLEITVSAGVVQRNEDADLTALLERVSQRLLEAKRGGRNRVC